MIILPLLCYIQFHLPHLLTQNYRRNQVKGKRVKSKGFFIRNRKKKKDRKDKEDKKERQENEEDEKFEAEDDEFTKGTLS